MSLSRRAVARIVLRVLLVLAVLGSLAILALWFLHERQVIDVQGLEPIYSGVGLAITALIWLLDRVVGRERPGESVGAGAVKAGKKATVKAPIVTGEAAHVGDMVHGGKVQAEKIKIVYKNGREARVPWQLPGRPANWTGREEELTWLVEALRPGRTVTMWGPGGMGKSALAAEALYRLDEDGRLAAQFPDGLVYYSFYGRKGTALAFEHVVRSFDEEARDVSAEAAQRALAGKQLLLALDGTEEAEALRAVLRAAGGCGIFITSRKRRDAPDPQWRWELKPLPGSEAVALLNMWQAADVKGEVGERIAEAVGRLPLAVKIAGRYLDETGETAEAYLAWLESQPIKALSHGEHKSESVWALLRLSLEQVPETARQALSVVGQLALAPFGEEAVAAALEMPERRARIEGLHPLVNYGLLDRADRNYQVSHALVHTYASRRMGVAQGTAMRLAEHYTALAERESKKGVEGFRRLDGERPHLMQVLASSLEREEWETVRSLVRAVEVYLDIQGHWTERVQALEMELEAVRRLENKRGEGAALGKLGNAYRALGQVERAIDYLEQALAIAREIGDRHSEGADLGSLGNAYSDLRQMEQAIDFYQRALAIAQEIGDRRREGVHLGNLGLAYHDLGQVEWAIEYYEQALAIAQEIGDQRAEGNHLGNLGVAYRDLGKVEGAIDFYQQALAIAQKIGDWVMEGNAQGNLGSAYSDQGQVERAIDCLEKAEAIFDEINSPNVEQVRRSLKELKSGR